MSMIMNQSTVALESYKCLLHLLHLDKLVILNNTIVYAMDSQTSGQQIYSNNTFQKNTILRQEK